MHTIFYSFKQNTCIHYFVCTLIRKGLKVYQKLHNFPGPFTCIIIKGVVRSICPRCCVRGCQSDQFSPPINYEPSLPQTVKVNFFALRAHFNTALRKTIWRRKFTSIMYFQIIFARSARNYFVIKMRSASFAVCKGGGKFRPPTLK